ncbi:hypothetical protein BDR03DRAFT_963566 [Suillus americanus]|nr:hypothetical protein BDR03DRAFT_963566 [Suillus americanus]
MGGKGRLYKRGRWCCAKEMSVAAGFMIFEVLWLAGATLICGAESLLLSPNFDGVFLVRPWHVLPMCEHISQCLISLILVLRPSVGSRAPSRSLLRLSGFRIIRLPTMTPSAEPPVSIVRC